MCKCHKSLHCRKPLWMLEYVRFLMFFSMPVCSRRGRHGKCCACVFCIWTWNLQRNTYLNYEFHACCLEHKKATKQGRRTHRKHKHFNSMSQHTCAWHMTRFRGHLEPCGHIEFSPSTFVFSNCIRNRGLFYCRILLVWYPPVSINASNARDGANSNHHDKSMIQNCSIG